MQLCKIYIKLKFAKKVVADVLIIYEISTDLQNPNPLVKFSSEMFFVHAVMRKIKGFFKSSFSLTPELIEN